MKKLLLFIAAVPLLMAHTCEEERYNEDYPCTAEARAGLNVSVTLNGIAPPASEGITVTARDGNYIEDLFPVYPDAPSFSGVYERPGQYIVTVRKQGYADYVSGTIEVSRDRCHVIGRQLAVNLIPE